MDPINIGTSMAIREDNEIWREVISFPNGTMPIQVKIIAGNGFKAAVRQLSERFSNLNSAWMTASQALGVITANTLLQLNGQEDIQYDEQTALEKLEEFTTNALRWSKWQS